MKKAIITANAPAAIGPYSQGVELGDLIFTSGQIPINPGTGKISTDIAECTRQSLENIKAILEDSGSELSKIIKTTVFLSDMNDFAAMNEVYSQFFTEGVLPARSAVQVARLPRDVKIEIEAIAHK